MDRLVSVERETEKYYCFIEICQHLFPETPRSTVRNWCRTLKISTVTCEPAERHCFRKGNPSLGGTFGLISSQELERLIDFRANKRARIDNLSRTAETITTACNTPQSSTAKATDVNNSSPLIVEYSDSSDEDQQVPVPATNTASSSDASKERASGTRTKKTSKRIQLLIEECSDQLQDEMKELRKFYERTLNPHRRGPPFAKATLDKLKERTLCFLFYCKNVKNIMNLSLSLLSDTNIYTDYLEYLRDERKLKPTTLVAHIIVAINVVKFNISQNSPSISPEFSPVVQSYQSFQRQFQREGVMLAKRSKEGLTSKSTKQFYFEHVLTTLRSLRDKYFESTGLVKSRHLHDFVFLATFVRGIPGRSKELRTMRLFDEREKGAPFDYANVDSGNYIVFQQDDLVFVLQFDFKTSKTAGPTKIDLSDDRDLIYYLKLYLKIRVSLLLGKDHDYFFCNRHGSAFDGSSAIAKYLGDIFEREVSIRASTTALRHSIVTYFNSLDESKDTSIRKSLALLMKHSVRYQESVYNDQSNDEKVKPARLVIRNKIAQNIFGEVSDIDSKNSNSSNDENPAEGDEHEIKPKAGDIVALLDPISTEQNIEFFLAKIARYSQECRTEVHLIHLERLSDDEPFYRLKPGRTWTESIKSVIFPIDCVWNRVNQAYELRTLAKDIFDAVYAKN